MASGATGTGTLTLGDGSYFWVLVGEDGANEGSYGTDGLGTERPKATGFSCDYPQDLARRCD